MSLHESLRSETASDHRRLESLPFFAALHAADLPKTAIVTFLRSLAVIHGVLERTLLESASTRVAQLGRRVGAKVPLLQADLDALDTKTTPSITPAIQSALQLGAEILRNATEPLSLVGVLYVLEGSQNGGVILQRAYARCLEIPKQQLSYFGCYGDATANKWATFVENLNALVLTDAEAQRVVRSAKTCFEGFEKICTALYPYSEQSLEHHVAGVNFEAGAHAMPQSSLEIDLALRAGQKAWERYPYLGLRFAERGKRFTSSDSCWLLTLTRMSDETATQSLRWLRSVLATRGLPTIILEEHLKEIARALKAELADRIEEQGRFDRFLAGLEAERQACGARELSELIETFEAQFRASTGFKVDSAAQLIASAWIDERAGIKGALGATLGWFVDVERFSDDWITTVNGFVAVLNQLGEPPC